MGWRKLKDEDTFESTSTLLEVINGGTAFRMIEVLDGADFLHWSEEHEDFLPVRWVQAGEYFYLMVDDPDYDGDDSVVL